MALVFQVRGDSFTAYRAQGRAQAFPIIQNGGTNPALITGDAGTGVLNGKLLGITDAALRRCVAYSGNNNWSKTAALSVLVRIVPRWTLSGSFPTVQQGVFKAAIGTGDVVEGMSLRITTAGKLMMTVGSGCVGNDAVNAYTTTAAYSGFTLNAAHDIFITWDGVTTTNGMSMYIDGVLFETKTMANVFGSSGQPSVRSGAVGSIVLGISEATLSEFDINEFVVWDSVEACPTFGRSDWISATALDASTNTSAGAGNIRSGVNEVISGVTIPGTLTVPSLANTAVGIAGDGGTGTFDGSTRWTDPGVASVEVGTAYKANSTSNNMTGTYTGANRNTDPGVANVRLATAYKSASLTNNRTGLLNLPAVGSVENAVTFDNGSQVGTLIRNSYTEATLSGQETSTDPDSAMVVTQGDAVVFNLVANTPDGNFDLSGATFTTRFLDSNDDEITIANGSHVADADQVTNKGSFTLAISITESAQFKVGKKLSFVTKVTQGASVVYFFGRKFLTVQSNDVPTV